MDERVGEPIRVLVADDHPSIRENLRYLLDSEPDLQCAGVVKDALRCVETCLDILPDVLVLDSNMPGIGGLSVARALRQVAPEIQIVFYTFDGDVCDAALAAGAVACIAKDRPYHALLRAIRATRPRALIV